MRNRRERGMSPKKIIDKSQAYFRTRKWHEAEHAADEDIESKRVKTFTSTEELFKDLDDNQK